MVNINETTKFGVLPWMRNGERSNAFFDILSLLRQYWSDKSRNLQIHLTGFAGLLGIHVDSTQRQLSTSVYIESRTRFYNETVDDIPYYDCGGFASQCVRSTVKLDKLKSEFSANASYYSCA
jgi:hypothetical protein